MSESTLEPGGQAAAATIRRPVHWVVWGSFWCLLVLVMWLPEQRALSLLGDARGSGYLFAFLATVALVGALAGLQGLLRARRLWFPLAALIAALVLLRLLHFGLVHFSGAGFTDEFFLHMEWQSVVVAWKEYRALLIGGVAGILVVAGLILLAGRRLRTPPRTASLIVLLVSVGLLVGFRGLLPEWKLFDGWRNWHQTHEVILDEALRARLEATGLVTFDIRRKGQVRASAPERPRNLILVYLESVGANLANQPDWPDLMPRFKQLLEEHSLVETFWASSYITIEGLTNSQCGTLFPFPRGSESMAGGSGLAENLPCMGDVLSAAGYRQVYLGGAGMSFAGKGDFLAAHGYDELKGMEYWTAQGLRQRPGKWGLSDAEIFEQSLAEIEQLHAGEQPFNLTLLTIGTHLPGYLYRECDAYSEDAPRFINAMACTDQLLSAWLDQLRARGLLRDTVLVITADHHVFPSPDMRELFGDSVRDRRLPLIVIGDDLPAAQTNEGALYDLAPTVLDLLGIEHNAKFALGRSLVRESTRPAYFIKRYADIYRRERHETNPRLCAADTPTEDYSLPLKPCARRDLLGALESLARSLSKAPDRLACALGQESLVLGEQLADGFEWRIGGIDQSSRFTHQGRTVRPVGAGIYLLSLDASGQVVNRRFLPQARLGDAEFVAEAAAIEEAELHLLVWRPELSGSLPDMSLEALGLQPLPEQALLLVVDRDGEERMRQPLQPVDGDLALEPIWSSLCGSLRQPGS